MKKGCSLVTVSQYIKTHDELKRFDFITVYSVIMELLKDGKMEWNPDNV